MNNPPLDAHESDDDGFDECQDDGNSEECETKRLYVASNQYKRLLLVLCIGLKGANGDPILNPGNEG